MRGWFGTMELYEAYPSHNGTAIIQEREELRSNVVVYAHAEV